MLARTGPPRARRDTATWEPRPSRDSGVARSRPRRARRAGGLRRALGRELALRGTRNRPGQIRQLAGVGLGRTCLTARRHVVGLSHRRRAARRRRRPGDEAVQPVVKARRWGAWPHIRGRVVRWALRRVGRASGASLPGRRVRRIGDTARSGRCPVCTGTLSQRVPVEGVARLGGARLVRCSHPELLTCLPRPLSLLRLSRAESKCPTHPRRFRRRSLQRCARWPTACRPHPGSSNARPWSAVPPCGPGVRSYESRRPRK